MPTATLGPWYQQAVERGLIREVLPPAAKTAVTADFKSDTVSEKDFMQAVLTLARSCGWMAFHVFDSRRCEPGFPDVLLLRGAVCVVAELKAAKGRYTDAQESWLAAFALVPGVKVCRWRPSDWADVVKTLTEPREVR